MSSSSKTTDAKGSELKHDEQDITTTINEDSLPRYHDSEPSSQPPRYNRTSSVPLAEKRNSDQLQPQFAGASRSAVSSMLAYPELDNTEKRSWRERWRALRSRREKDEDARMYRAETGSSAHWNVFGSRIDGGVTMERNMRR